MLKIYFNIILILIQFILSMNFVATCAFSSHMRATCLSHFQTLCVCVCVRALGPRSLVEKPVFDSHDETDDLNYIN